MKDRHPTFPNPTIQEALCEIHYHLPGESARKASLLGEFYKQIQPDFPVLEPVTRMGLRLEVGPSGIEQFLPPQQRMLYRHASRNLLLQLSTDILTVNELRKYPGWEQMKLDVLYAWQKLREAGWEVCLGPDLASCQAADIAVIPYSTRLMDEKDEN